MPVLPVPPAPVPPPEDRQEWDRQECLSSTKLPAPQPRIAAIDLAPAAEACRLKQQRVQFVVDVARARVEANMALAELRGLQALRIRRIVVIADPATL